MLVRRIKDTLRVAKANGHALILLGCRLKLPAELEHEFTHIDFTLPGPEQLGVVLDGIVKSASLEKKDLPDSRERAAIWDIVIAKYGRKPTDYDPVVLARACEQFTGAEIEAVFIDALHEAFAEGAEPGERKHILPAIGNTVPLAHLMDGRIAALRHRAKGRAREAGTSATKPSPAPRRRRVDPRAN